MHRQILTACLPGALTLAVLCGMLWLTVRASGARLCLARLRDVHRCEAGGVQSLAFILTLPVFLMILMFIVQVALLMTGLITVNYAAFAAARSAAVWIPAYVDEIESQNRLAVAIEPGQTLTFDYSAVQGAQSKKLTEIFDAATLGCMPIAPSRDIPGTNLALLNQLHTDEALLRMFTTLAPASSSNARLPQRINNKLAYSLENTLINLSYLGKDPRSGPTHNPPADNPWHGIDPLLTHRDNELGWQDPVTVEVRHHFALLPGAGRFLAALLYRFDGRQDTVAPAIDSDGSVYKTWISASATLTIEGLHSVHPYEQEPW